jgi:sodium/hydrogen antiporter
VAVLLLVVRPVALGVAMLGAELSRTEFLAAAWFGPKGFASIAYGLLVLAAAVPHSSADFGVIAAVIAVSIVAHSSTDVLVAKWFAGQAEADDGASRTVATRRHGRLRRAPADTR